MHGLQALVAIDLLRTPVGLRKAFYYELEKDNWVRLGTSGTMWSIAFRMPVRRMGAMRTIQFTLHKAKEACGVKHLEYAVQMDVKEVVVASA